jgi:hypothetical protein
MTSQSGDPPALQGKTYTLFFSDASAEQYYDLIRNLTDSFLERCPDEKKLLSQIRNASGNSSFIENLRRRDRDTSLVAFIRKTLQGSLSAYTKGVRRHLLTLPLSKRFDATLRTKEAQYHLYMVEIELTNRICRDDFRQSSYRFALIAHCLRDFRPLCRAEPGEYESVCRGCSKDCLVNLGSVLLKRYDVHPLISVSMDLDTLFTKIKSEKESVGALGIACVPELVMGMRLCMKRGIPAVGIPLDANRCARWMKKAHETSFSLEELDRLLQPVAGE